MNKWHLNENGRRAEATSLSLSIQCVQHCANNRNWAWVRWRTLLQHCVYDCQQCLQSSARRFQHFFSLSPTIRSKNTSMWILWMDVECEINIHTTNVNLRCKISIVRSSEQFFFIYPRAVKSLSLTLLMGYSGFPGFRAFPPFLHEHCCVSVMTMPNSRESAHFECSTSCGIHSLPDKTAVCARGKKALTQSET